MHQLSIYQSLQDVFDGLPGKYICLQISATENTIRLEAGLAHEAPLDVRYINRPSMSVVATILSIPSALAASLPPSLRAPCV
jgi:hypothetical protein